jgi:hypothetical protein
VYSAIAVELSGLRSKRSLPLRVQNATTLRVLLDVPSGFSWTRDRYLVEGREVSSEAATPSADAVREILHLHDGVIRREWLQHGEVVKRHDLNLGGKPIRRLFFKNGELARRDYYDRAGGHVSTELFDSKGFITESIHGRRHWWYQRGVPQRLESGSSLFVKDGERWIRKR